MYLKTDLASQKEISAYLTSTAANSKESAVHQKILKLQDTTACLTNRANQISQQINHAGFYFNQLVQKLTEALPLITPVASIAPATFSLFKNYAITQNNVTDIKQEIAHTLNDLKKVKLEIATFQENVRHVCKNMNHSKSLLEGLHSQLADLNQAVTRAQKTVEACQNNSYELVSDVTLLKNSIAEKQSYGTFKAS